MVISRDELKNSLTEGDQNNGQIHIDFNEVIIICAVIAALGGGLMTGHLSETAFVGLMGTFLGYTFGRIFNHIQGKE
jgi:hypothetical protein